MNPRQIIQSGITASAVAHLSVLTLVVLLTEVRPFNPVRTESITVDLVSPDQIKPTPKPEEPLSLPKAQPSDAFNLASPASPAAAPASPPAAQQRGAPSPPGPKRQQAAAQPPTVKLPPATASPLPGYIPPEPDLTVKYHVMLGLPPELPLQQLQGKSDDDFEAPAAKTADLAASLKTEFRRYLRTCSKLPESIAASDDVRIKLQVIMTPDGRLAREPVPIEGNYPADKGPALMQSAITALQACQPYTMLPKERYSEWRVLDLVFTPQDFAGG